MNKGLHGPTCFPHDPRQESNGNFAVANFGSTFEKNTKVQATPTCSVKLEIDTCTEIYMNMYTQSRVLCTSIIGECKLIPLTLYARIWLHHVTRRVC